MIELIQWFKDPFPTFIRMYNNFLNLPAGTAFVVLAVMVIIVIIMIVFISMFTKQK